MSPVRQYIRLSDRAARLPRHWGEHCRDLVADLYEEQDRLLAEMTAPELAAVDRWCACDGHPELEEGAP